MRGLSEALPRPGDSLRAHPFLHKPDEAEGANSAVELVIKVVPAGHKHDQQKRPQVREPGALQLDRHEVRTQKRQEGLCPAGQNARLLCTATHRTLSLPQPIHLLPPAIALVPKRHNQSQLRRLPRSHQFLPVASRTNGACSAVA